MQIEKLSKELKELRKEKSDEYGPFNKKMQDIADIWSVLIGKKLDHIRSLSCMQQQKL